MSGYIPNWELPQPPSPQPAPLPPRPMPPPRKPTSVRPKPENNGEPPSSLKDVREISLTCVGSVVAMGIGNLSADYLSSPWSTLLSILFWTVGFIGLIAAAIGSFIISRELFFRWFSHRYVRPGYRIATFGETVCFLFFVSAVSGLFWSAFIKESPAQRQERIAREWKQYEKPLPASGASYCYSNKARTSSLSVNPSFGSHYFIKLVDVTTGKPALICFIRSGCNATVDVPPGTYEIRYASGKTWYGEERLFGPETSYSKADKTFEFASRSGYTITLFKVHNGNLRTSSINKNSF